MTSGRRALTAAIAGMFVFSPALCAQEPESRPASRPAVADQVAAQETALTKKEATDLLEQLKKDVEDPTKLASVRVLIEKAARAADSMGPKYHAAVMDLVHKLKFNTIKERVDQARIEALAAYDRAVEAFHEETDGYGRGGRELLPLYLALIAESDQLVERLETPEYEAKIPERDMLSPKERTLWGKSIGVDYAFTDREIWITGVPVGKKITGVGSILPPKATPWHDLVIELGFTILQGELEVYLRYDPPRQIYLLKFNPKEGYELNKPYRMTIRVKGSSISLEAPDQPEDRDKFDANRSRTGGVGFGLNPGSKVVFTSCKLKVLR